MSIIPRAPLPSCDSYGSPPGFPIVHLLGLVAWFGLRRWGLRGQPRGRCCGIGRGCVPLSYGS